MVLEGAVREVRQRYAGNTIEVAGDGPFDAMPDVLHATKENGLWRLSLNDEVTPQQMLHTLVERSDITVEHFSQALPSLEEIFIRVVSESNEETSTNGVAMNGAAVDLASEDAAQSEVKHG